MLYEPAFPDSNRPGMCMRDDIATKAMTAFVRGSEPLAPEALQDIAERAYRMADAMLQARDREFENQQLKRHTRLSA